MPSERYSTSEFPLSFLNGRTASEVIGVESTGPENKKRYPAMAVAASIKRHTATATRVPVVPRATPKREVGDRDDGIDSCRISSSCPSTVPLIASWRSDSTDKAQSAVCSV